MSQAKREEELLKWIREIRDNIPVLDHSVIYLFYDGYEQGKTFPIKLKVD
jgi:hypothetical protein